MSKQHLSARAPSSLLALGQVSQVLSQASPTPGLWFTPFSVCALLQAVTTPTQALAAPHPRTLGSGAFFLLSEEQHTGPQTAASEGCKKPERTKRSHRMVLGTLGTDHQEQSKGTQQNSGQHFGLYRLKDFKKKKKKKNRASLHRAKQETEL